MKVKGYLIMNRDGLYYREPGSWVADEDRAKIFNTDEALRMLHAFAPRVSVVRVNFKNKSYDGTHATQTDPDFVGNAA